MVDSPGSMVLLGSVQRGELVRLIDRHIGRERRLQVNTYIYYLLLKIEMF